MSYLDAISFAASLFVKASVILGMAWVISLALRRRSAALRHLLWSLALVAILALPLMSVWMPPLEVDASRAADVLSEVRALISADGETASPMGQVSAGGEAGDAISAGGTTILDGAKSPDHARPLESATPVPDPASSAAAESPFEGQLLLWGGLIAWLCVTGGLLLLFFVHLARIRSITAVAMPQERISRLALETARQFRLARLPRVLIGPVPSPIVWGLLRPVVLLPDASIEWSAERLTAVLKHEFAHIRRRDYATHIIGELTCALYWPNPLVWFARYRLQTEQERACDDAVLRNGTPSYEYAEHLLDVTRSLRGPHLVPAGLRMARKSSIKERIRTVLDPRIERKSVSIGGLLLVLFAISLSALPTAALRAGDEVTADSAKMKEEAPGAVEGQRSDAPNSADAGVAGDATRSVLALTIEAETADIRPPMKLFEDETASGGRYVMVPVDDESDPPQGGPGRASLRFDLEDDARYWIWARVIGEDDDENSFFVSIDDREEARWDIVDEDDDEVEEWSWLRVTRREGVGLQRGVHELTFRNRENGSRLDAVFVTTDPDLIPRGRSPLPPAQEPHSVTFEAEQPDEFSAPLEIRTDEEASGEFYIAGADGAESIDEVPENGRAVYHFDVPRAGTYVVWGRVITEDDDENSFWIRVNGGQWVRWNGIDEDDDWRWRLVHDDDSGDEVSHFTLRAGPNTLEMAYREDGAKMDRFLVTNDPYLHPEQGDRSEVTVIFRD